MLKPQGMLSSAKTGYTYRLSCLPWWNSKPMSDVSGYRKIPGVKVLFHEERRPPVINIANTHSHLILTLKINVDNEYGITRNPPLRLRHKQFRVGSNICATANALGMIPRRQS